MGTCYFGANLEVHVQFVLGIRLESMLPKLLTIKNCLQHNGHVNNPKFYPLSWFYLCENYNKSSVH